MLDQPVQELRLARLREPGSQALVSRRRLTLKRGFQRSLVFARQVFQRFGRHRSQQIRPGRELGPAGRLWLVRENDPARRVKPEAPPAVPFRFIGRVGGDKIAKFYESPVTSPHLQIKTHPLRLFTPQLLHQPAVDGVPDRRQVIDTYSHPGIPSGGKDMHIASLDLETRRPQRAFKPPRDHAVVYSRLGEETERRV